MTRHPAVGTALFALVGPPIVVVGLVPWLLTRWQLEGPFWGWRGWRSVGVVVLVIGALVVAESMARFARKGRGTPAPWAPTARFVASGLYRCVRNPMYVGILAMLVGESLLLGSVAVLAWAACIAVAFHVFVVLVEEPSLRRRFGTDYDVYCGRVRRWLPRLP